LVACLSNSTPPKPPYTLKYEFYSDKNYQYIYRLVLNNADACTKQGVVSKSIAEGQMFTDIKAADVTISLHAQFG
jgi:tRNA threonylcarbamoyladenosine modification (KEOPS) complex  Pcc1 subunit